MAKTVSIEFKGYYRESKKDLIPSQSGIYCVYRCVPTDDGLIINELLYIGESQDVKGRLANHNKQKDWERHLRLSKNEILCYTFGAVPPRDRVRCESALISQHQPPENIEYTGGFNDEETTIVLTGRTKFLESEFTVK
ncbi:GIY-YIG nuclease family protein [Aeromonas caviae]|uniref:GIY-YIG nuclease family protein n=1 Tax=Aeromonas caviae TaxID=648 RepID=UPI002AB58B98|nr:GIY-YIG nuclease family protein [Aeromonas caviae]MDY7764465.1 GIY-YIG nuclease family protein [Aeromonas caviae]